MAGLFIRVAVAFVFFCATSFTAHGQVLLQLNSRHFNAYEPIKVTACRDVWRDPYSGSRHNRGKWFSD